MHGALGSFLEEVVLCINRQNGPHLAQLFSLEDEESNVLLLSESQILRLDPRERLATFKRNLLGARLSEDEQRELWGDLVSLHLRILMVKSLGDTDAALAEQVTLVQTLHRIFVNSTRWILPLVYTLNHNLYKMCFCAEAATAVGEECARILNKTLTICLTDRSGLGESRKWGVYRITSLLFRAYFRLGQLNLGQNVLRAIGAAELPATERYPAGHMVVFRYWLGRWHFVGEEYGKAEELLHLAWSHCPADERDKKKKILHYLIPLRILHSGLYPTANLLARYSKDQFYSHIIAALRKGDLCTFLAILSGNEDALLRLGTFLIWEKIRLFAYRNLLRRIYSLMRCSSRISILLLVGPFRWLGLESDVDEIGCTIAILISKGMIRGYISQERATLVLSQKDPFPKLSSL